MQWLIIGGGAIVGAVLAAVLFTDALRYAKTGWLILQVSPYEQTGNGSLRILILGDSTGYGTGAKQSEATIAGRLGALYADATIDNNSSNGRKLAGGIEAARSLTKQYDLVLIQMGANDLLAMRPVEEVIDDMTRLIQAVEPHTKQVVVTTAGNIGALPIFTDDQAAVYQQRSKAYTEAMLELTANWPSVTYVSYYDEPKNDPFVAEPERYIAWDGLHPTREGYKLWFEKMLPKVVDSIGAAI